MSPGDREILPLTDIVEPSDAAALAAAMRQAYADSVPIYPIGGGTSLDFGLVPRSPGLGFSLVRLNQVIDFPARDMTITVEAGIRMSALAEVLAGERQRLPIDVPQADRATLGGVIATNFSGPLRYGHGTIRDYVIGISAVDGQGMPFKGGGRVVKNVAGYDFCKLLVGSLGTLGIISQVTLKVKPIPEATALVACPLPNYDHAERLLAALVATRTNPAALELLAGPAWRDDSALMQGEAAGGERLGYLLVALEGTAAEVEWMAAALLEELKAAGGFPHRLPAEPARAAWSKLREFPADLDAALVAKISVPAGRTLFMLRQALELWPDCSVQAHAGNGVLLVRIPSLGGGGISRHWIGQMQPAAQNAGGSAVILSCSQTSELTRLAHWGKSPDAVKLMEAVHQQFDPKHLLNPGRFVY